MTFAKDDVIDGKYRVVRMIGEGGMGHVYEGINTRIGRRVAIKVLTADISASAEMRRRFEREAQVAAKIGSPHICDVLDLGDLPSGESYLVMEYLEGHGMDTLFDTRVVPAEELCGLFYQLLDGLAAMHDAGIIHRDLKPANVFICRSLAKTGPRDIVKILDFGVSKFQNHDGANGHVTQTGAVMGTPLYMSPEQARGEKDIDGRSDIYAVGVMMYRGLTGQLPFEGDNFPQLLFKIALEQAPPIATFVPDVDPDFAAIIERAMAKAPADRFADAREFQGEIARWARANGQTSLALQKTMRSNPPGPAADATSSPKLKAPTTPRGLDEKSTPTAWEKNRMPSSADLGPSAATDRTIADSRPGGPSDAKTPAPSNPGDVAAISSPSLGAAPTSGAVAPAPAKKSPILFVGLAALVLGGLGAAYFVTQQKTVATNPPTPVDSAATSTSRPVASTEPVATATTTTTSATAATADPVASTTATVAQTAAPTARNTGHATTASTAGSAPTAPASAATTATTAQPTPTTSASGKGGRKIRTEL